MKKTLLGVLCAFVTIFTNAQTDDLMIVEYVDWSSGAGVGIKVYNPTSQTINLSDYSFSIYYNGSTTVSTSDQLFGTIGPNQFKIFGNAEFCGDCNNNCNQLSINGVNTEDVVAITKGINHNIIDMFGAYGSNIPLQVSGVSNATYKNKLVRNDDNCVRYFDLAGTTVNSWPDNPSQDVTSWTTFGASCLSQSPVNFQIPNFDINADTTICNGEEVAFDFSNLNFDSYEWIGENNNTASIQISEEGLYTLEVGKNFCLVRDDIEVLVEDCDTIIDPVDPPVEEEVKLLIPNIITPNSDGYNDRFEIKGVNESVELFVYNRWGTEVYTSKNYGNDWSADDLSDGVYFYLVKYGFVELKGWVEIRR